MLRRILITSSILTVAASFSLASGCSSSSSGNPGTGSSSGGAAEAGDDTSSGSSSGASGSSSGGEDASGSSSGTSGSSSGTGSSSGSSEGGGGCTAATSVTGVPTYTTVEKQSACSAADVTAFVAACASSTATPTTCNTWFTTAANATCAACIQPTNDAGMGLATGATIYDNASPPNAYPNTPGCVALVDGNTNCAAPLEQLSLCEDDACNSAACLNGSQTDYNSCITAADMGACSTELSAAQTPCGADAADGGALSGTCSTIQGVITEICGNGQ